MKRGAAVALLLLLLPVLTARAQQPLSPAAAPAATPAPAQSPAADQQAPAQQVPAQPAAPGVSPVPGAAPPPPVWLPRGAAVLILLDKISAEPHTVTVKVGGSVTFGALTIGVTACAVRPPDQPEDATAFIVITDSHAGMAGFRGWIFADEPATDMFQDPVYDVRLAACGA